jgi:hypothetical protein
MISPDLHFRDVVAFMCSNVSALVRWTLTRHFLASFSSAMNDRAGITSTSNISHEEMKQTALKRDEAFLMKTSDVPTNPPPVLLVHLTT